MKRTSIGRRLVRGVRGAGQYLRWQAAAAVSPPADRIAVPPWTVADNSQLGTVVARYDAPSEAVVRPRVYGGAARPAELAEASAQTALRPLALMRYTDIVMARYGTFVLRETGTALPPSFPTSSAPTPIGAAVRVGGWPVPFRPLFERIEGPAFVADGRFDEFGHAFVEAVPSLMLLRDAPADIPVATSMSLSGSLLTMGQALGVAPERWRHVPRPTVWGDLFVPDSPVRLHQHVHPIAREAFDRLGRLGGRAELTDTPERIFLSRRRIARRKLRNEAEIEALFQRHGFTIIHPETLPIEAQIALMQRARMVAGAAGSAMHLMVFAPSEARVLMLSSPLWFTTIDTHLNPIEGRLGYVFGEATVEHGEKEWLAPWTIDAADVEQAIRRHFDI